MWVDIPELIAEQQMQPQRMPELFDYNEKKDKGARGKEWTPTDKTAQAIYQILNAMDWAQTRQIARQPEKYWENDSAWLIGKHPSRSKVNAMFLANAVLHPVIANALPKPWRDVFNAITIGTRIPVVMENQNRGLDAVR